MARHKRILGVAPEVGRLATKSSQGTFFSFM
jgi:hypothetical protein